MFLKKYLSFILVGFLVLLSISCDPAFLYNPNEIDLEDNEKGLSAINVTRIQK